MKVVVLGGYGVFGGRLCRLLLRDRHEVMVAGRSLESAQHFCNEHGGIPLHVDISGDLAAIFDTNPDIVIDAVGPYQTYRDAPYRIPKACIENHVHYLDLSDDGPFSAGICVLDECAKANDCVVLSGVSSVPALSSAVVAELRRDLSNVDVIETAILPGNRAPRGRSVMTSILSQAGRQQRIWRGGRWHTFQGWSQGKTYDLGHNIKRRANLIGAPDLDLFPHRFQANSVIFRAGLELKTLHFGLAILAFLSGNGVFKRLEVYVGPLLWFARCLHRMGTDRGAMCVDVVGNRKHSVTRERWTLIAEAGEGPFIPGIPARTFIRHMQDLQPGARPALCELPLRRFQDAMSDLNVRFERSSMPRPTLFQKTLGTAWNMLPAEVRRLHCVQDIETFSGRANVTRGKGILARLAALAFRFPAAGSDVPITVCKTRTKYGEAWERNFAGRRFRSYLTTSTPGRIKERFLAFNYEQDLLIEDGNVQFLVRRGWVLGLPIPSFLLPRTDARESVQGGRFHFNVGLYAPLGGGLIVRYSGWLEPDAEVNNAGAPD